MSLRSSPVAIGLFMMGGAILATVGVVALASLTWFGDRQTFVSYFDESVNGLERGAPVKFQGVPVGTVTELLIQIDLGSKAFQVPVQYEIDLTRLTTQLGAFVQLNDPEVLRDQISGGLRAQLQMVSIVTGQLYVELSYRSDAERAQLETRPTLYPEIPTTPSLLAAFGTEAGSLVGDILEVLFRVNEILNEVDMLEINSAVVASAQAVERFVGSDELRVAIGELPDLAAQLGRTLGEMETLAGRLNAGVDPLQARMDSTLAQAERTLRTANETLSEFSGLLTTDSGIGYGLDQTLTSLREAADALRSLTNAIERNPDMLIRGTAPPGR